MPYRINHIHLKAADPRKTADWYVKAFRFTIVSDETRVFGDRFVRCQSEDGTPVNISGARTNERLGISVSPVPSEFARARRVSSEYSDGLLVTDVSARGAAYRELFPNRDIIVRVLNPVRREVHNASDLEQVVAALKAGDVLSLLVWDTAVAGDQYGRTRVVNIAIQ